MRNEANEERKALIKLFFRPQLFKMWIMLSTGQITIHWIAQLVPIILIRWIGIYPVNSAIERLNPGQEGGKGYP